MNKKIEQFKSQSSAELKSEIVKLEKKLQEMRFDVSFNKLKNTNELSAVKKNIARANTLLNQK